VEKMITAERFSLTNFTVMVNLSSSNFNYAGAKSDGTDLRFIDADGSTQLKYHIEKWNTSGSSYIWVNVTSIDGSSSTDHIWMYYGYTSASDIQDVSGTYDDGFVGVWHLNETSGTHYDSTSNNNDGTPNGGVTQDAAGKIDGADEFDGSDDYIAVSDSAELRGMANVTIGLWVNLQTKDDWNRLIEKADDDAGNSNQHYLFILNDLADQKLRFEVHTTTSSQYVETDNAFPTGEWVWVVGRYNGSSVNLYVNGNVQTDSDSNSGNIIDVVNPLHIGAGAYYTTDSIDGRLDDVRISNVARSADWIKAQYLSMTDDFITYGNEETLWWNDSWPYRMKLTFNNSGQSETLTNFPVLVILSSSNFDYSDAKSDGTDLRFIDADCATELKYHFEDWNTSGSSYVWVNVSSIDGSSSTDHIWMYYGYPSASDVKDAGGTYDPNFLGVWHLNETGTGTRYDSTSNNYDGTPENYDGDEATTGQIDGADNFNENHDVINASTMNPQSYDDFTIEAWFQSNSDTVTDDAYMFDHGIDEGVNPEITMGYTDDSGHVGCLYLKVLDMGSNSNRYYGTSNIVDQQLHYLVAVRDDGRIKLHVDGVMETNDTDDDAGETLTIDAVRSPYIGDFFDTSEFVNGILDEVRVSDKARSADWIMAQNLSMTDNFIIFSTVDVINYEGHGAAYIFFGYSGIGSSNINAANANVTIHGSNVGDLLGWSVSDAGNVNGDSYDDIIIGAPGYGNDKGRAYVFHGRATSSWTGIDDADADADAVLTGHCEGDMFGSSVSGAGDVNHDKWPYRKKITINASKVTGDLSNFPALVSITDSDLRDKARHNGYDIYFTSSDGTTKLDHEIEKFNSHTGELVAWVEIQSLSSSSNTEIYMYYGKENADDQSNPTGVWDSNFVAVWHLSENPSGTAPQTKDSTSPYSNGTTYGSMTSSDQVAGKADGSLDFDGTDDYVDFANPSELQITGAMTLEGWVRPGYVDNDYMIAKMGSAGSRGWDISFDDDPGIAPDGWVMFRYSTDGSNVESEGYARVNVSEWYYVVGVFNPSTYERFYVNGELDSEDTTGIPASQYDPSVNVRLARRSDADPERFDGIFDEVRISTVARSHDWINATYNNMNDTSSFYTMGNEEANARNDDVIVGAYGFGDYQGRAYIFYGPDFDMSGYPCSYAESISETELANTATYADYLTLTVKPATSTGYLIIASSDVGPDGTSPAAGDKTSLRLRIDDDDSKIYHEVIKQFEDATDWYHFSATKYVTLSAGSHDIELEYKTDGDTGTFRNTRIVALEMAIPEDQYAENEDAVTSSGNPAPETTAATMTFTPSSSGDYLIIASANVFHDNVQDSVWGRLYVNSTVYGETILEVDDTQERQNFGMIKKVTLDSSSHTIKLTVQNHDDAATTASMNHSHIAAIRLDTFSESHYNETEAQNTGGGAWETLAWNAYSPTTEGDFIVLGTAEWLTNEISAVYGVRMQTDNITRQESQLETQDPDDRHMTFMMDKRRLSGAQNDTVDHRLSSNGWSKFARLIALPAGTSYVIMTGEQANDRFGFSVSNAGDVDSDGYKDVIVGAPGADKAYICAGHDPMTLSIDAANASVILSGDANTDFGWSVANCSNINNASNDDVIVGAPGYNSDQGRAYIFDGVVYNDIVTADYLDDTVTIYNGTTGGWGAKGTLKSGKYPFSVFVGDANNDGYNDILTSDTSLDTVTVYNGTRTGGWEANFTLSVGQGPYQVFVGDADNDGYNDILTADRTDNTVSIFNGTASGEWEAKATLSVGSAPFAVVVADANNDGYNDILTVDNSGDTVTIYNGSSTGSWEAQGSLSVGNGPVDIFVGDANNDGYNDILTADQSDNTVSIYNGTSGHSWEAKGTLSTGTGPRSIYVGDANNDGYNDIVTGDFTADTITIYNGTSSNDWEAIGTLSAGDGTRSVFIADANNDGYNDILTADTNDDTVTIYNGTSGGSWEAKYNLAVGNFPYEVFVANVDNDVMGRSVGVANANLTLTGESTGDKFGFSVHYAGDIDGDGYPDVVVGAPYHTNDSKTECGAVYVYRGGSALDATADYTNYGQTAYDHFGWSVSHAGDINNDNYNDIVVGAPGYDDTTPDPDNNDAGKAYVLSIIPEFGIVAIPIVWMVLLFVWRRRKKREYSDEKVTSYGR
jgi:hypothetical protein